MKISIIIATYNSESTIEKCLDSILNQSILINEILVIDGKSIDNTIYIIKKRTSQFNNVKIAWGLLAWIPLAIAIASANPDSTTSAIQWGAAVGFTTYAVFNGTEIAIRPDWTPTIGIIDLAWGSFASSIAAYTLYTLKI